MNLHQRQSQSLLSVVVPSLPLLTNGEQNSNLLLEVLPPRLGRLHINMEEREAEMASPWSALSWVLEMHEHFGQLKTT